MDKRQMRTVEALNRVLRFVESHPLESPPPLLMEKQRELAETIASLHSFAAEQAVGPAALWGRQVNRRRERLRRDILMPLIKVAKPLLSFAPGAERLFRLPHARASHGEVAAHVIALAAGLEPYRDLIQSAGYSDTFIEELRAEGEALARANEDAAAHRQRRSRATLAMRRGIEQALAAVSVIEGILLVQLIRDDAGLLATWRSARRIHARQGRPPKRRRRQSPEEPSPGQATT